MKKTRHEINTVSAIFLDIELEVELEYDYIDSEIEIQSFEIMKENQIITPIIKYDAIESILEIAVNKLKGSI